MGKESPEANGQDETQAHHVSSWPQKDRGGTAGEVGKGKGAEEGGVGRGSLLRMARLACIACDHHH
ncbi:MAG: hypothetical protein WB616_00405 [Candidatus Sulfotelmatobacter sp.]